MTRPFLVATIGLNQHGKGRIEMVRDRKEIDSKDARSQQIWQVLVGVAARRQTIEYRQLARQARLGDMIGLIFPSLHLIADYCQQNGFPILPVLVVNRKRGGQLGVGMRKYLQPEQFGAEMAKVHGFEWHTLETPTAEDLKQAHQWAS